MSTTKMATGFFTYFMWRKSFVPLPKFACQHLFATFTFLSKKPFIIAKTLSLWNRNVYNFDSFHIWFATKQFYSEIFCGKKPRKIVKIFFLNTVGQNLGFGKAQWVRIKEQVLDYFLYSKMDYYTACGVLDFQQSCQENHLSNNH